MLQRLSLVCPMKVSHDGPPLLGIWSVMCSEDTPHYIFINIHAERLVDLLSDPWTSIAWIALF